MVLNRLNNYFLEMTYYQRVSVDFERIEARRILFSLQDSFGKRKEQNMDLYDLFVDLIMIFGVVSLVMVYGKSVPAPEYLQRWLKLSDAS